MSDETCVATQPSLAALVAWGDTLELMLQASRRLEALTETLDRVIETFLGGPEGIFNLTGVDMGRRTADGAYQVGIAAQLTERGLDVSTTAAALSSDLLGIEAKTVHLEFLSSR